MPVVKSPATLQEHIMAIPEEYAKTKFLEYMSAHRNKVGSEADGCVTMELIETYSGQAVFDAVTSMIETAGMHSLCQAKARQI